MLRTRCLRISAKSFTDKLFGEAMAKRQSIVLPEGEDARVVEAAIKIQEQGIADVTVLGDADAVWRLARERGLGLGAVRVIDPSKDMDNVERYAMEMERKRRHKGVTVEQAACLVQSDAPIYGTLMVACGDVDGMVSGACHTSADTIRPALQLIGNVENSIVSSLMFMLLEDQVVIYADCALQVSPNADELGAIAASSAHTAKAFGIDPHVALLSFATGFSNDGPLVQKVRSAAEKAKELLSSHNIPVFGPLQYDAAVNKKIAAAKGENLTNHSTVLVFPDLNCGNITYKAVQQSTGCVVMGPVLQGLRRPVNDLSRGCTVEDIISTTAVTALQSQDLQVAQI
eukprot:TRINITY_DN15669_c0_g1_i1.p1 TRINITY_DN15669_c0_g1~~TRINITY_DN15669_c0_g1_i1.p1  ORF type:complete len:343 (+),score=52.73 TRINITY_DN15669_c0_g1_i1:59-1087(+)